MSSDNWISRGVARLRPGAKLKAERGSEAEKSGFKKSDFADSALRSSSKSGAKNGVKPSGDAKPPAKADQRSTKERLEGSMRHSGEALSPRLLRRTLEALQAIIDPRVGEVEGGRRAKEMADAYQGATLARRRDLWLLMSEMFTADRSRIAAAKAQYVAALGTPDEALAEVRYRRATVSRRRRLLQRFSVYPEGIRFLVDLRAEMQSALRTDKRLRALDMEMEYMFSTWFDVGFLELRRISWDSPASLIEKLIKYEAVHDIKSWADVKNRLDSDRRCYGYFHPRLPEEPLIFVEVAFVNEISNSIEPLLDESAVAADLQQASTAIFYSISNTQAGLRGVSFGDSLIKRVVESLKAEFPNLKVFSTLSPIPGLRTWLGKNLSTEMALLSAKQLAELGRAVGFEPPAAQHVLSALDAPLHLPEASPVRTLLMRCAARYLALAQSEGKPADPVARFHLGNGARVERLNWAGDPSVKGVKQSFGLMVNYLYDLKRLDKHLTLFSQGKVAVSSQINALM
jgi:malonyl-CoA decarboxylase